MTQWEMLSELAFTLHISPEQRATFRKLRSGVDYTQNPVAHGGGGDGSIPLQTWTAARDAAAAFEALDRALELLHDEVIPF